MTAINTRAGRPGRRRRLTRRLLSVAVLVALIAEACVTGLATAGPARADDLGCKYTPTGLIAKRWARARAGRASPRPRQWTTCLSATSTCRPSRPRPPSARRWRSGRSYP